MGKRNRTYGAWLLAICLTIPAGRAGGQTPAQDQLARFQEKVRRDMTSVPNYTCLESIERSHREPHARAFKPVDTVRVEVSSVAGKELFAWPGSRQFEDRDVTSMVTGGAIGSGMFAMFAHTIFVAGKGALEYRGEEDLAGHRSVRYDFHLTEPESGFEITANQATETVAAKGAFWFDPATLDLIRLDVYGDHMPYSLRLEEAVTRTFYVRIHIGDSDALLPRRSELTMAHFSGEASRNAIDFSACHEYRSESTISFDAPPAALPEVPKPRLREVRLPAGLLVPIDMETAIDSKTAAVGDTLHARVAEAVRYEGELAVPRGAAVTGHLRKLDRGSRGSPCAVGVEFSEVEWEGAHAAFDAELAGLNGKSAGARRPVEYYDGRANKVLIENGIQGVGVFYMDGAKFRIAPGLHMVWRTVAPAAGAVLQLR